MLEIASGYELRSPLKDEYFIVYCRLTNSYSLARARLSLSKDILRAVVGINAARELKADLNTNKGNIYSNNTGIFLQPDTISLGYENF